MSMPFRTQCHFNVIAMLMPTKMRCHCNAKKNATPLQCHGNTNFNASDAEWCFQRGTPCIIQPWFATHRTPSSTV